LWKTGCYTATIHFYSLEEEEGNAGLAEPKGQWAKKTCCENNEKDSWVVVEFGPN
jgi:hypothetical protein